MAKQLLAQLDGPRRHGGDPRQAQVPLGGGVGPRKDDEDPLERRDAGLDQRVVVLRARLEEEGGDHAPGGEGGFFFCSGGGGGLG